MIKYDDVNLAEHWILVEMQPLILNHALVKWPNVRLEPHNLVSHEQILISFLLKSFSKNKTRRRWKSVDAHDFREIFQKIKLDKIFCQIAMLALHCSRYLYRFDGFFLTLILAGKLSGNGGILLLSRTVVLKSWDVLFIGCHSTLRLVSNLPSHSSRSSSALSGVESVST